MTNFERLALVTADPTTPAAKLMAAQRRADLVADPTPEQLHAIHLAWADLAA